MAPLDRVIRRGVRRSSLLHSSTLLTACFKHWDRRPAHESAAAPFAHSQSSRQPFSSNFCCFDFEASVVRTERIGLPPGSSLVWGSRNFAVWPNPSPQTPCPILLAGRLLQSAPSNLLFNFSSLFSMLACLFFCSLAFVWFFCCCSLLLRDAYLPHPGAPGPPGTPLVDVQTHRIEV